MKSCRFCSKEIQEHQLCSECMETETGRINTVFLKIERELEQNPLRAITVWEFHQAPESFQELSVNGGDEDWVVYVPLSVMFDYVPRWIEAMDSCNEPDEFTLPDGSRVYIGSHA